VLQGHNVFGGYDISRAAKEMFYLLSQAYPDIYRVLDIKSTEIMGLDCTYSAVIESSYIRESVIDHISVLGRADQRVEKRKSYVLVGAGSSESSFKIYEKGQELAAEIEKEKKKKQSKRLEILTNDKLIDYANKLLRFEACYKRTKLVKMGIPTNLYEFLKFQKWHHKAYNEDVCIYLWKKTNRHRCKRRRNRRKTSV
jgi:II/X family phage/plasmid replication protein